MLSDALKLKCPPEGLGVNGWTWYAAKTLYELGVDKAVAKAVIMDNSTRQDQYLNDKEVSRSVDRTWEGIESQHKHDAEVYARKDPDLGRAVDVISKFLTPKDQLPLVSGPLALKRTLDLGATYAVGRSVEALEPWIPNQQEVDAEWTFICPNPLADGQGGRCRENISRRDYWVVEFDDAALEWQLGAHALLGTYQPCKLLVFSGNKSYHGWYTGPASQEFQHLALSLGADPTVLNRPEQWVRIPGGTNGKTSKPQEAYSFD